MSLRGVLVSGNIVLDTVVRPVDEIKWGGTIWVESMQAQLGGNGGNTAYAIAKLGASVRLIGALGSDEAGTRLRRILADAGVDTSRVARIDDDSPTTIALVKSDGTRAFLHRPGVSRTVFSEPIEFTDELCEHSVHYHLANPYSTVRMREHAAECLRRGKARGLRTSLDTGWDSRGEWMKVLAPCLPFVDILFVNDEEARRLTGRQDVVAASQALREGGTGTVVIKLGSEGASVDGRHVPGFPVEAVDTTGAGDCFVGGFLAGTLRGANYDEAARFANAVAALSVLELGSVTGLRSYEETVAWATARRPSAS